MNRNTVNKSDQPLQWADQLPAPLWDDLDARPAEDAATAIGADWDGTLFKVPVLNTVYLIHPQEHRISREAEPGHRVSYQSGVVLLTTLAKSMGVPPSGRMVTPLELTGGALFFTGAHSLAIEPIARRFSNAPDALVAKARELGGQPIDGADRAVCLPGLPRLPLYVLLWTADEEFAARAVIGIDDRALFHLDLAGILALTNVMAARLIGC
jgi:hypothetical protein